MHMWHPTPVLLPGKSHGRKSLVGCSPWGREESDMTEWLHFSFFGSFFITNSVSVLVINLFMFSISSWFSLSRFLRIYPCLVGCPICCSLIVHSSLLQSFVFLWYICNFSFISDFIWGLCLFFLVNLAKGLSVLFIFSVSHLLISLVFSIVFLASILIIFTVAFLKYCKAWILT